MSQGAARLDETPPARVAAAEAADCWSRIREVQGVLLFGSVARRMDEPDSDIDLLVVGTDLRLTRRALMSALPIRLRRRRFSVQYFTEEELAELFDAGTSFAEHLRCEGVILFDRTGSLRHVIDSPSQPTVTLDEEMAAQLDCLAPLEDWAQYNGNFLFCLAQLYRVGKAVVILALLRSGVAEFDQHTLFETYASRHPDRAADVERLLSLRPFYRMVAGRAHDDLPFSYRDAESQAAGTVAAIRNLAAP